MTKPTKKEAAVEAEAVDTAEAANPAADNLPPESSQLDLNDPRPAHVVNKEAAEKGAKA